MIGGLSSYIKDYTTCINNCESMSNDQYIGKRYDNLNCVMNCNKFYTFLRQSKKTSIPVIFNNESFQPVYIKKYKQPKFNISNPSYLEKLEYLKTLEKLK